MLNKKERTVMQIIYSAVADKKALLISPHDVVNISSDLTLTEVDKIVSALAMDGYFDLVYSDRHGEKVYCITLTEKGRGFRRDITLQKRNIIFRVSLSVGLAFLSFIIGLVLKAVFS